MADFAAVLQHFDELNAVVMALPPAIDRVSAEIADLKALVAAGGVITQAQLDNLDTSLQALKTDAQGSSDRLAAL